MASVEGFTGGCSGTGYDYLLLVQEWPADFGSSSAPNDTYTMHGLWPSRNTTATADSYPCSCTHEEFDASQLASIRKDLNTYWPTLMPGNTDQSFWDHEWSKHGTCAGPHNQLGYFNTTLSWRRELDVYNVLAASSVVPGKSYNASDFDAAFTKAHGAAAMLGCDRGNKLREVSFCLANPTAQYDGPVRAAQCTDGVSHTHGEVTSCDRSRSIAYVAQGSNPGPSPSPPGPSPPGGKTCAHGQHGPKCSSDKDCAGVDSCRRCAHSGYCTDVPLH